MKLKKRIAAFLLTIVCCMTVTACAGQTGDESTTAASTKQQESSARSDSEKLHHIEITVKDYGTIKAELYEDVAPITVQNFISLADSGFYDGLTFHRIKSGFMIQGGAPKGNGTGGSEKNIKGEFARNGVENNLKHKRGVLSMARANDPDSASSQFFIMHQDAPHLDGSYAAFGCVTEGMEIVDKICENTKVVDSNGTVLSENQPVIESIKVID